MTTSNAVPFRWILWLNTVGETMIAFGMFFMPANFFPGAEGLSASIARAFSFAILAVAYISFSVSHKDTPKGTVRNVVSILLFYHLFQLAVQFINAAMFPPLLIPPVVIHVIYSSLFLFYAVQLRKA